MRQAAPSRELDKVIVRLPNGMRPALAAQAAANHRSVNGEIVYILERALRAGKNDGRAEFPSQPLPSSQNQPVSAG
jgi:hypothetical protein